MERVTTVIVPPDHLTDAEAIQALRTDVLEAMRLAGAVVDESTKLDVEVRYDEKMNLVDEKLILPRVLVYSTLAERVEVRESE